MKIAAIKASVHFPYNHHYVVQNLTAQVLITLQMSNIFPLFFCYLCSRVMVKHMFDPLLLTCYLSPHRFNLCSLCFGPCHDGPQESVKFFFLVEYF